MHPYPYGVAALMEPGTRAAFGRLGRVHLYPPRHCLMLQGGPSDSVMLLENGLAEVCVSDADGHRAFVTFRGPGSLLGEYGMLDGSLRCATVTTLSSVRCRVYSTPSLREFLQRHPDAAGAVTTTVVRKTRAALDRQFRYGTGDAGERIARALLDHADAFGRPTPEGTVIDVPLSHARIADLVHGSASSVAKYVLGWSRQGLLTTGYRGTRRLRIVDRPALEELATAC